MVLIACSQIFTFPETTSHSYFIKSRVYSKRLLQPGLSSTVRCGGNGDGVGCGSLAPSHFIILKG